ncbi:MAG: hypothetical protein NTW19_00575 [Planctomycetota bacterium]|nr:hypothetical protein [Planctomycetota bacterium]
MGTNPCRRPLVWLIAACCALVASVATPALAQPKPAPAAPEYFHLRQGVTFYVANPEGKSFDVDIDLKDINTFCRGPQTTLFKVYDPEGKILHDEFIPDDGVETGGYDQAWAGWDHEMWALGATRQLGAEPFFRWEAFSDPRKIDAIKGTQRTVNVKHGMKGVYQIMLAGCDDHFVHLTLSPGLKYGVVGHPDFFAGSRDQLRTAYLFVPPAPYYATSQKAIEFWVIEHGYPRTRRVSFSLDGKPLALTDTTFKTQVNEATAHQGLGRYQIPFEGIKPGSVIQMTSQGAGDFMLRVHDIPAIFCNDPETAKYIAGGLIACSDGTMVSFPWQKAMWESLLKLKAEDFIVDTQGGKWNQMAPADVARMQWGVWRVSNNPAETTRILDEVAKIVRGTQPFSASALLASPGFSGFNIYELLAFYLYPFKGNALYHNPAMRNVLSFMIAREWLKFRAGEVIWEPHELNVAYAEGFHWDNWESILDMKEQLDPAFLKPLQQGVANMAQRLSCANALELVISNGRTTVPQNIYHAHLITGDERLKALAMSHLSRMVNATDGWQSAGSKAGFFKEHFAADGGYCTYPLYQLGRMYHVSHEPEALAAVDRLSKWVCYMTIPDGDRFIGPTSWNARISASSAEHMWGHGFKYAAAKSEWAARLYRVFYGTPEKAPANYNVADPEYEAGKPLPPHNTLVLSELTRGVLPFKPLPADSPEPFFENLGDANEFFCVRRGKYYAIAYAGRRTPFWMDATFGGPNSFTGGGIAGLYVQGVGATILGRVNREYGWPPEAWNEFALPVAVGECSNGRVFNTGVSRCTPVADKNAWTLATAGEAVDAPVNFERSYQFNENAIAATITLRNADMNNDVFQYREHFRKETYLFIKEAWELVPLAMLSKEAKVVALNAAGAPIGDLAEQAVDNVAGVEMTNGKGGVRLKFDHPRTVRLSSVPAPARAFGHGLDNSARAVQIKLCDKLETGDTTLKYEIEPWVKP